MRLRTLALRVVANFALALWIGGFTFYGAVVVPILHEDLDSLQAGGITRRVTDSLNLSGLAALAIAWPAAWSDHTRASNRVRRLRFGLLALTSLCLIGLMGLHVVMDSQLDAGRLRGFYPWHRIYLILSTVQWFVNLALIAAFLASWTGPVLSTNEPA
ncbi:MAG: DUF4149 domain-containing protein [Isosphaeraceae bacterium]